MPLKVLVLGGTGQIGGQVSRVLHERGGEVTVLCRSSASAAKAEKLGVNTLLGDIATPERWAHALCSFDAVIHAAATFECDMSVIDSRLLSSLIERLGGCKRKKRLIYTGGGWLFGNCSRPTGETAPYSPPAHWQWMARNSRTVVSSTDVEGLVIHPANVIDEGVGVPAILLAEARAASEVRVPAPLSATWPLVGRHDLGELYALALEKGKPGEAYIGASESAVALKRIAQAVAKLIGSSSPIVWRPMGYWMEKYGNWTSGYGLTQNLSAEKAKQCLGWKPFFESTT